MADHPTNEATDAAIEAEGKGEAFLGQRLAVLEDEPSNTSIATQVSGQTEISQTASAAVDEVISGAMSAALQYLRDNIPKNESPVGRDTTLATPTEVLLHVQNPSHQLRQALEVELQFLRASKIVQDATSSPPTTAARSVYPILTRQAAVVSDPLSMAAMKREAFQDIPRATIENTHPAWSLAETQYAEPFFQRPGSSVSASPGVFSRIEQSIPRERSMTLAIRSFTPGPFALSEQSTPQPPTQESILGVGNVNQTSEDPYTKALRATKSYTLGEKPQLQAATERKGTWYRPKAGQTDAKKIFFCCICLGGFTEKSGLKTRHFPTCEKRYGNPFDLPWDTHPTCQKDNAGLVKVNELGKFLNDWHKENDHDPYNVRPTGRTRRAPSRLQNVLVASPEEDLSDERQAKRPRVIKPEWKEWEEWDEKGFDHGGWKVINRRIRIPMTGEDEDYDKEVIEDSVGNDNDDDEDEMDEGDE